MKKIVCLLLLVSLLVFAAACGEQTSDTTTPNTTEPQDTTTEPPETPVDPAPVIPTDVFNENDIVLSFGALSDIHLTGDTVTANKLRTALSQLKAQAALHDKDGLDAVGIAGDIADTGNKTQVDLFAKIIKESGVGTNVMLTTGNHDYYGDKDATLQDYYKAMGEEYFSADVNLDMLSKGARHCVVNGYHFLFLEPTTYYRNNCPYDASVITWLNNTLSEITAADPNAYVFVFTHPMIYNTCYGSDFEGSASCLWYTTHLTETLKKYPQVMTFSGHLHFPINDERSIMQTDFTSLGCGSVRYLATENGYSNMAKATVPKDAHEVSVGYLVQVDGNGNIRITRMDFSNQTTFKSAWEVSFPTEDRAHLTKYTKDRSTVNKTPVLSGTPEFVATVSPAGSILGASITVPAGTDDDMIHHYKITLKNNTTGSEATYAFLSDFYRHSQPSQMSKTFTFPLELTEAGKYTVTVVAVDSWSAESNALTFDVTVGSDQPLSAELPDAYADLEFASGTATDKYGKLTVELGGGATVASSPLTFAGTTKTTDALTITGAGQYGVVRFKDYSATTVTDFYNSETGYTVEVTYINRAPKNKQGVACGTQKGGFGLAESAGVPYLYTYVGASYISISAPDATSTTELTHIVATTVYDAKTDTTYTAIYVNGKLANSGYATGKMTISSAAAAANAFCLGADISAAGIGSELSMTDFVMTDMKLYSSALNEKQVDTAYTNAVTDFAE